MVVCVVGDAAAIFAVGGGRVRSRLSTHVVFQCVDVVVIVIVIVDNVLRVSEHAVLRAGRVRLYNCSIEFGQFLLLGFSLSLV